MANATLTPNREKEVRDRLDEIGSTLEAWAELEEATPEQDAEASALETEGEELKAELTEILAAQKKAATRNTAEALKAAAKQATRVTSPGRETITVTPRILKDPKRGFESFGHFAQRVYLAGPNPNLDQDLMRAAAGTAMSQTVNEYGGVLVPPAFSTAIWDAAQMSSQSLLSYCTQIPIDQGNESITFPAVNETSRGDGSRWGGVRGYWKAEETQMTETRPKLRQITLKPQELYVFGYLDDKLLRNAPGAASAYMEMAFADEIAFKIGDGIINGDGSGKPIGVIGHAATLSISKETGQTAATVVRENVNKMYARMHPRFMDGAVWFCNQDVIPALEDQKFEVGVAGVPAYFPPGGQADAPYARLKGKPVIPIEYCATLGTVGDLIFANLKAYAVAIKGMTNSAYSMHLKFDYNQTAFRMIFELDGQPFMTSVVTPYKGSNTVSPIITLATRS